jgi:hypothetical protein
VNRHRANTFDTLARMGISYADICTLVRASATLHTWHEHECNGTIQREGDDGDGRPYWYNAYTGKRMYPTSDREKGARKRIDAVLARYPGFTAYVQGDPRGCALYIIRPGDVPEGCDVDGYYSRGIAVVP